MNNPQDTPTTLNFMVEREKNIRDAKIQILELHPGFGIFHYCNLNQTWDDEIGPD